MKWNLIGIAMVVAFGTAIARNNDKCDAHLVRINPDTPPRAAVPAPSPAPLTPASAASRSAPAPVKNEPIAVDTPPPTAAPAEAAPEPTSSPPPVSTAAPEKKAKSKPGAKKVTAVTTPAPEHRTMGDYTFAEELP